jgi:hypothetical protein
MSPKAYIELTDAIGSAISGPKIDVQLGPAGYLARQTTAKTGPNLDPALSEERYAVNGLGLAAVGAFPKQKANVTLKYFKEFANRATYQGYAVQVAGAISF